MACRWVGQVDHFPGSNFDFVPVVLPDHAGVILVRAEDFLLHGRVENGGEELAVSFIPCRDAGTVPKLKEINAFQAKPTGQRRWRLEVQRWREILGLEW